MRRFNADHPLARAKKMHLLNVAYRFLEEWQTLIAGLLALGAAIWTIKVTRETATKEIDAAQRQTDTALRLDRRGHVRESYAFLSMMIAAMDSVLADVALVRSLKPEKLPLGATQEGYRLRMRLQKNGFAELRSASVGLAGKLTQPFLALDKKIDVFRDNWVPGQSLAGAALRLGDKGEIVEELNSINQQAETLRGQAEEELKACLRALAELEDSTRPTV